VDDPVAQVRLHLVELGRGAGGDALEEVVGAGDHDALAGWGRSLEDLVEDFLGAELVVVAGEEELGLGAGGHEAVVVVAAGGADGQAEGDEAGDAGVSAGGAEADVGTEGEAGEENGFGELVGEPVDGGADVVDFAVAFVVDAFG